MPNLADVLADVPANRINTVFDVVKETDGSIKVIHSSTVTPPERRETQARNHCFSSAKAFLDYVKKYGGKNTLITVLPSSGGAMAVLDETAAKGVEIVYYKPTFSPQFAAWQSRFGSVMGMDKFRDFITERSSEIAHANIEVIKKAGSKETQETEQLNVRSLRRCLSQIVVSTSQKAFTGVGAEALNGVVIKTSVKSATDIETSVTLPESIVVNLPMFVDHYAANLLFDLDVQALSAEKAGIRMTFGQMEAIRAEKTQTLLLLVEQLGVELGCVAGYGEARHEAWQYIT